MSLSCLKRCGYSILRLQFLGLCRLLFQLKVREPWNLPKRGAAIVVANHSSYLDPVILGIALPRPVVFTVMKPVYDFPPLAWFFRIIPCIPLNGALNRALETLSEGKVVGIFPEGGRSRDGKLKEAKTGAARLGAISGVPVVPVGIVGAYEAYPPQRFLPRLRPIEVRIGRPITLPELNDESDEVREEKIFLYTKRIMKEVENLMTTEEGR